MEFAVPSQTTLVERLRAGSDGHQIAQFLHLAANHACRHRGVAGQVNQDEAAGAPVLMIGIEEHRLGGGNLHAVQSR